jgi:predicted Zn-dependent peptidase
VAPGALVQRETLPGGLRLVTEAMPHVRSVSIGVWLTRGSRHEPADHAGIAHFVEHMLFKGTPSRSAEDIAQQVDSIGGQLDAFTSKEYAGYYVKVLDEHLPLAIDILADLVSNPLLAADDIEREQKVVLEEIKMVEDTPDDLVHEIFAEGYWNGHPLGRPILGHRETVASLNQSTLQRYFRDTYVAGNFVVVAVGNLEHDAVRSLVGEKFSSTPSAGSAVVDQLPVVAPGVQIREKDLEQSHVCLGTIGLPQNHPDRFAAYALNTVLGGSMSSRLFQNVREKRGLAYSVFSSLTAYQDVGSLGIYAGCGNEAVSELVEVVVHEIRRLTHEPMPVGELRRAKDHLKGSLMLNLESTSSRMSHHARQEIYRDRADSLDEMLAQIERVTVDDVQRLAATFFSGNDLAVTVLGAVDGLQLTKEHLRVD